MTSGSIIPWNINGVRSANDIRSLHLPKNLSTSFSLFLFLSISVDTNRPYLFRQFIFSRRTSVLPPAVTPMNTVIGPPRGPVVDFYTRRNYNSYILCPVPGDRPGGEEEKKEERRGEVRKRRRWKERNCEETKRKRKRGKKEWKGNADGRNTWVITILIPKNSKSLSGHIGPQAFLACQSTLE